MIDKGKPIDKVSGTMERRDHVYAINQAGDFSKKSVKEPEWPQNATEKQPLSALNENQSLGAKRFEDIIRRVTFTGDIPRGIVTEFSPSPAAVNAHSDSANGIIALPPSSMLEKFADRIKNVSDIVDGARNPPDTFPLLKSRAKIIDKNDPGSNKEQERRMKPVATVDGIPNEASQGKRILEVGDLKNRDLKVI